MTHHLNYCRQIVAAFEGLRGRHSDPHYEDLKLAVIEQAKLAQKFILPVTGRLIDDPGLRAIDELVPLHLPYGLIALEYESGNGEPDGGLVCVSKHCVFALEQPDGIWITPVAWVHFSPPQWIALPPVRIPSTNFLDRSVRDGQGNVGVCLHHVPPDFPSDDYADEVGAVIHFLNALTCKNVHVELSGSARRARRKAQTSALPFDEYHILTIDVPPGRHSIGDGLGTHRSPREHLRRGHIRRLQNGSRVWVNATVVNPGVVAGVVSKSYELWVAHDR